MAGLPPISKQVTAQEPDVSDPVEETSSSQVAVPDSHSSSKQVTTQESNTKELGHETKDYNVDALRQLATQLEKAVSIKDRTYHLKTYPHCFLGNEAVDWLCRNEKTGHSFAVPSRTKAVELGQQLCNHGFIRSVPDIFKPFLDDPIFYRFYAVPTDEQITDLVGDKWVNDFMESFFDVDQKSSEWVTEKVSDKDIEEMEAKAWSRAIANEELKAFKVVVKTKVSIDAINNLIHTKMVERHGEWNATYVSGKYLHVISPDLNVQYWKFNPGAAITNRDFVCVRRRIKKDDASLLLIDRSIDTGLMPPVDDCIRGVLPYNVRYMRKGKFKDGSECTEIHYVNVTDIRGWMPKSLMNKVNVDVSLQELHHIVAALSKH